MDTGLAIHHDYDSPGEAPHHIGMEEKDSQESVTLKNALKPLPDTQPSQLVNPDFHQQASAPHNGGLRLLSRPQDTNIDPAASFTYGKPIRVTPGQFGRAIPTKLRNPISEEALDNNSPSVKDRLTKAKSQAVASDQVQPLATPIARNPARFDDNHTQNMPPDSGDQLPTPRYSADLSLLPQEREMVPQGSAKSSKTKVSRQHPHTDSQGRHSFTTVTQENLDHPQHYQQDVMRPSAATTGFHEQKQRLSLPNDTSVSSPRVPENPPCNGPSRQASLVNRPIRDIRQARNLDTPAPRATSRSSANNSNISKKRSGHHTSVPGTARTSRKRSSHEYDESPTRRHGPPSTLPSTRDSSSPQNHILHDSCDYKDLAGGVVQSLNSLFNTIEQNTKQKDAELTLMERRAQKQQDKLSKYKRKTEGKINDIQQLEQSHTQLQEQLAAANQQLADRSEKTLRLEEKCRQYKEYLNSAIAEQQGLYKAANIKCETAITQMRDAERKLKAMNEHERGQVEATRERLTQVVKSTITEYRLKEKQFTDKIESLNEKLQEQETNMSRERENTQKLLQKDETIASFQGAMTSLQDAIKSIGSQVEQVAIKVKDVASRQVNQDEAAAKETQSKLDIILERLSALDEQPEPSIDIVQKLQEANEELFASILEHVTSSQAEAQAGVQKLSDSIEDYMEDFWTKLEDREGVLTELLDQIKAENEDLQISMQLKDEECNDLSGDLSRTEAQIRQLEEELVSLKEEISEVEKAQAEDMAELAEAKLLRNKYEALKRELAAEATLATELQSKLQASEAALTAQGQEHANNTEQLRNLLQRQEETAREAQKAAVETVRKEIMDEMTKDRDAIQMLLKQAEGERETLQIELDTASQRISAMQEEEKRVSDIVSNLQTDLEATQSNSARLRNEANNKAAEHQMLEEEQLALITGLKVKLAEMDQTVAGLEKETQTYNRQSRKVLSNMKQWALECKDVKDFASEIEKAEQGDIDSIDPKFRPLFYINILHRSIFRYFQTQEEASPSSEGSQRAMPSSLSGKVFDTIRRVTIRTPLGGAPSPRPPSVQTEQMQRRMSGPPKSILRSFTDSNSPVAEGDEDKQSKTTLNKDLERSVSTGRQSGRSTGAKSRQVETVQRPDHPSRGSFGTRTYGRSAVAGNPRQEKEESRKESAKAESVQNRGNFNRGPYNRPVAGTKYWPDSFVPQSQAQKIKLGVEKPSDQDSNIGEAYLAREPQKRKSLFPQESEVSRKRARAEDKRASSLSVFATPQYPSEQQASREQDVAMPSAPRKRGLISSVVGSEAKSPTRFPLSAQNKASQTPAVVPDSIQTLSNRRTMSSQESSQNSSAPYYQRRGSTRGHEESQDSLTHSQDVTTLM